VTPDLPAVGKFALLALVAMAVGRRLAARLVPSSTPDERRVIAFPLGMALLALATAGLLFARLPARNGLAVLLAAGVLWARAEVREGLRGAVDWLAGFRELPRSGLLFRGVAVAVAAFGIVGCLAPETGWDTGVYHFSMARLWAEEGRVVVRPDLPFSFMPAYMEVLYAAGFLLHGEALASFVNFGFYFAGLALAVHWARSAGGPRASLLAGFAYLSGGTYVLRTGGGDVEVAQAVYYGLAVYALLRVRDGGGRAWAALAGLAFGMLLGIKYASAWLVLAAGSVWLGVRIRDRAPAGRLLAEAGLLAAVGVAVASPWYVRNVVVAGNPLAPFAAGTPRAPWGEVLPVFFPVTLEGLRYDGLALLGVLAAGLPGARAWRWILASAAAGAVLIFIHLAAVPSPYSHVAGTMRYASATFLPLFAAAGTVLDAALSRPLAVRAAALGLLALWAGHALALHAGRNGRKVPVALGRTSRDAYLDARINSHWALRRAERELPAGKKVLLAEVRSYYCRAPFVHASDQQPHVRFDAIRTAGEFRKFLEAHAIGIIVANEAANSRTWGFKNLVARLGPSLADAGVEALESRNQSTLYRVR
jgi:hypothetical protein